MLMGTTYHEGLTLVKSKCHKFLWAISHRRNLIFIMSRARSCPALTLESSLASNDGDNYGTRSGDALHYPNNLSVEGQEVVILNLMVILSTNLGEADDGCLMHCLSFLSTLRLSQGSDIVWAAGLAKVALFQLDTS